MIDVRAATEFHKVSWMIKARLRKARLLVHTRAQRAPAARRLSACVDAPIGAARDAAPRSTARTTALLGAGARARGEGRKAAEHGRPPRLHVRRARMDVSELLGLGPRDRRRFRSLSPCSVSLLSPRGHTHARPSSCHLRRLNCGEWSRLSPPQKPPPRLAHHTTPPSAWALAAWRECRFLLTKNGKKKSKRRWALQGRGHETARKPTNDRARVTRSVAEKKY